MWKRWGRAGVAATVGVTALALAAPVTALIARWHNDGPASFRGWACGDLGRVTLALPPGAFAVKVVRPHRGAKLRDRGTGQTVATITSVVRTRAGVVFAATGSDDVCTNPDRYADTGWQTKPVSFRVNYKTRSHLMYPSACDNPNYRPSRIVVACGDGTFYIDAIRWSAWTDGAARGVGTAHLDDCTPDCARGRFRAYRDVVVELGYPSYCRPHNDYEFTRLRYTYTGARPSGSAVAGFGPSGCAAAPKRQGHQRSSARDRSAS